MELKLGYSYKLGDYLLEALSIENPIVKIIAKTDKNCSIQTIDSKIYTISIILMSNNSKLAYSQTGVVGTHTKGEKNVVIPEPVTPIDVDPSIDGSPSNPEDEKDVPEVINPGPQEEPEPIVTPEPEPELIPDPIQDNPYDDPYGDDYV